MTQLYVLSGQYLALQRMAEDSDIDADTLRNTLEGIEGSIELKAQGLLQVVRGIESDIDAVDAEIKRLTAIKNVRKNRIESLRDYLKFNMENTGINKITCPLFSITLAKAKPMVIVEDESLIPKKYIKTTITKAPVKADILTDLKAGKAVAGCVLGESQRSLTIK